MRAEREIKENDYRAQRIAPNIVICAVSISVCAKQSHYSPGLRWSFLCFQVNVCLWNVKGRWLSHHRAVCIYSSQTDQSAASMKQLVCLFVKKKKKTGFNNNYGQSGSHWSSCPSSCRCVVLTPGNWRTAAAEQRPTAGPSGC